MSERKSLIYIPAKLDRFNSKNLTFCNFSGDDRSVIEENVRNPLSVHDPYGLILRYAGPVLMRTHGIVQILISYDVNRVTHDAALDFIFEDEQMRKEIPLFTIPIQFHQCSHKVSSVKSVKTEGQFEINPCRGNESSLLAEIQGMFFKLVDYRS